jgi:hypothetical protein
VQGRLDVDETPLRTSLLERLGLGDGWMDQRVPFQCSTRVDEVSARSNDPTAVQALPDVHQMPLRTLRFCRAGFGDGWIDHRVPFQRSARVNEFLAPPEDPTAVQALLDVHETSLRMLFFDPAGSGVR